MTKRRTILAILLGILMALCLSFAVACGGGEEEVEQGTIRWTINDKNHVTVTVDGKTDLPSSYAVGETLTFRAVPANGYEAEVKNGRTTLRSNNNNEYSFAVKKGNNDVSVAVSKKISGIQVTANKDLVYYAGETVNNADLTVKLLYATGESETKTDGFIINYPTVSGRFALGDESFTVTYGTVTSAAVALKSPVVGKVTLDPQGGKIADDYRTALEANTEIANITVDAKTHALTFTFAEPLNSNIVLPAAAMMTRGETQEEQSDFEFVAWSNGSAAVTAVPAELDVSATYTARWNAHLLELSKIYYELDDTDSNNVIPQLIVEGTYRAAKSAYLYLYEGNDQVELVGPTIGGDDVKRGDAFKLTFDMREVLNKGYRGKWMDIKFVAETDGVKDTQEIDLNDYAEVKGFCDEKSSIHYGGYTYYFQVHTPDGSSYRLLKAVADYYIDVDINVAGSLDSDGMPVLTVSGTLRDTEYYGKTMNIDWWIASRVDGYGVIGNDGTFSIEFKMADWPVEKNCYAHISIVESQDDLTKLFPQGLSGDFNLPIGWVKSELTDNGHYGEVNGDSIKISSEDYTKVFYVGKGTNGGLIAYGRNERQSIAVNADVALKVDSMTKPTKVYYVVKAEIGGQVGYTEDELKNVVFGNTDGGVFVYHQDADKTKFTKDGEKIVAAEFWFDVTAHKDVTTQGKTMLWSNLYFEIAPTEEGGTPTYSEKILEIKDSNCSTNGLYAVVDGIKYTILCTTEEDPNASGDFKNNTYNSSNLICTKAAETDTNPPEVDPDYVPPVYSVTIDYVNSKLEMKDGKPILTLKGDVEGYTKLTFELQEDGTWVRFVPATQTTQIENGKFTITVDLSDVPTTGARYYLHILTNFDKLTEDSKNVEYLDKNGTAIDMELAAADDATVLFTVTAEEIVYSIVIQVRADWNGRHMITMTVVDDTAPVYNTTKAELVQEENKVYFVVTGTSKNYTDANLASALQAVSYTFQHNSNIDATSDWKNATLPAANVTVVSGAWTIKIDITDMELGSFTGHVNGADFKLEAAEEKVIELNGKKYVLVNKYGSSAGGQFWGCVGLEILSTSAEKSLTMLCVGLELDEDIVYYAVTLRAIGYTQTELQALKMGSSASSVIDCSKVVADKNGIYFTLYYDITTLETPQWYWTHMYKDGTGFDGSNGDINADVVNGQVSYNGKKYEIIRNGGDNADPQTYWIAVLNVSAEN